MKGLIVAVSENNIIGLNGNIPWYYPLDFKRFKEVTLGTTVIMGRNTWNSIPTKFRPLAGRRNLVVSSNNITGVETFKSIPEAMAAAIGDIWFIGGKGIYEEALALGIVDIIDVTYVPDIIRETSAEAVKLDIDSYLKSYNKSNVAHPDERLGCIRYYHADYNREDKNGK